MFRHIPIRTLRSIPQVSRLDNILLQRSGDLPLVVIVCGWRRRNVSTGQNFSSVCEDLRSPPFHLSIFGRWNAANKRLACDEIRNFYSMTVGHCIGLALIWCISLEPDRHILVLRILLLIQLRHSCRYTGGQDSLSGS